jgi:hypothetical protein
VFVLLSDPSTYPTLSQSEDNFFLLHSSLIINVAIIMKSSFISTLCKSYCILLFHFVSTFLVFFCPPLTYSILSCPNLSCLILSCPNLSCLMLSCPNLSCSTLSCTVSQCVELCLFRIFKAVSQCSERS